MGVERVDYCSDEEFEYGIEANGKIIAKFLYEFDRDIAQEALAVEFEDTDVFSPLDLGSS